MGALEHSIARDAQAFAAFDPIELYRLIRANETRRASADPFMAHVMACALAAGILDARQMHDNVSDATGLGRAALAAILREWLPGAGSLFSVASEPAVAVLDEEESQLFELLSSHKVDASEEARWIVAIVARRAMAPRHLWQDLGLANRAELSQLVARWFPKLAAGNVGNMKWKKFFYRKLCELEGFTLCAAPTCAECSDFHDCFGDEDAESGLARLSRR